MKLLEIAILALGVAANATTEGKGKAYFAGTGCTCACPLDGKLEGSITTNSEEGDISVLEAMGAQSVKELESVPQKTEEEMSYPTSLDDEPDHCIRNGMQGRFDLVLLAENTRRINKLAKGFKYCVDPLGRDVVKRGGDLGIMSYGGSVQNKSGTGQKHDVRHIVDLTRRAKQNELAFRLRAWKTYRETPGEMTPSGVVEALLRSALEQNWRSGFAHAILYAQADASLKAKNPEDDEVKSCLLGQGSCEAITALANALEQNDIYLIILDVAPTAEKDFMTSLIEKMDIGHRVLRVSPSDDYLMDRGYCHHEGLKLATRALTVASCKWSATQGVH